MSFGSSKSSSKPVYYPEQRNAMNTLLAGSMGQLGLGGTQAGSTGLLGNHWVGLSGIFPWLNRKSQYNRTPQQNIFDVLAQPYTGQFTAPMTNYENEGLNRMLAILNGSYDPRTSDYYQGMRTQAFDDLADAKTRTRQAATLGGMLASTPRINQENTLERKTMNDLNTLLGGMYETERNRIQETLPQFMQAAGIERGIQQSELDKQYQDRLRQLQALGLPLQTALQIALWSPGQQTSSSGFAIGLPAAPQNKT